MRGEEKHEDEEDEDEEESKKNITSTRSSRYRLLSSESVQQSR